MGHVRIQRVYQAPESGEYGVLVDRLWPRGIRKERVDQWLKNVAPSPDLRKAFDHKAERFQTFRQAYRLELAANSAVDELRAIIADHDSTALLYGARDPQINHAIVLLGFLNGED